jgi:hypothetical protein
VSKQRIESASKQAVSYRNYRRARDRALVRLAQAYPDEYKEYLEQEKAYDESEGKKWVDITGRTNAPRTRKTLARKTNSKPRRKASNKSKATRNKSRKR